MPRRKPPGDPFEALGPKLLDAFKRAPITHTVNANGDEIPTGVHAARLATALERARIVQRVLIEDIAMLEEGGPSEDAMERVETLWLAAKGAQEKKSVHQRAIVTAVREAKKLKAAVAERVRFVRAEVQSAAPGALDRVDDSDIEKALQGDLKSALVALLQRAGAPATKAMVDKYAFRRRR